MEPLAEENDKLKEAMNLMERNIHRAQCEQDLAESNMRGLEYQKGILSEQLAAMSKQLRGKSEQLASASTQLEQKSEHLRSVSEQKTGMTYRRMFLYCLTVIVLMMIVVLVEQDAELGQLRQAVEQLREEKTKETGRADKLAEELNGEHCLVGLTAKVVFLLDGTL